jgi:WbqC-like protein family
MILSVHQPQYLPWLGYFHKIAQSDVFVFLDNVQYKAREFQNRNKIRTQKGGMWLTVPVISKKQGRQMIADVRIDNNFPWPSNHWDNLKTWYGHAEYFRQYADFFNQLYKRKWERLIELNLEIINFALNALSICKTISFESELKTTRTKTERIIEICKKLNADTYLSGAGGRQYLEEDKFVKENIRLVYQDFKHPTYRQQFMQNSEDFIPCMSIADLLFNEGPKAQEILGV